MARTLEEIETEIRRAYVSYHKAKTAEEIRRVAKIVAALKTERDELSK